ncbi:branched-chain amino acid transport system II carrier protein [Photobacterium leiognathi]|uniref:branched-chain amino acid transport system II carrier protein n=1 Tax=Photobacterium leiognathi TaxID=553611 RepID=UPI00273A38F4|nr:branched-chain amino acid transport system II carrier protein [Photobacterium leiognathi]
MPKKNEKFELKNHKLGKGIKLKNIETLGVGLMTYSLFLGAGNIIYPPMLGIESGESFSFAILGFLITSVGLPAAALLIMSKFSSEKMLTSIISPKLAVIFWGCLYLVIGPAFGMPRAVNVAYEMGVEHLFDSIGLTEFSVVFLLVVILFCFWSESLVSVIGKVITPLIVIMIFVFTLYAISNPADSIVAPSGKFEANPLVTGLLEGYMTMDVLAAIGFGIIILNRIREYHSVNERGYRSAVMCSIVIYITLMSFTYVSLAYIGQSSNSILKDISNGADVLTQYSEYSLGNYGRLVFSLIILLACFTTLVGLATSCGQFVSKEWGGNYRVVVVSVIIMSYLPANFGLNNIIAFSLPVILTLCPVAIILLVGHVFGEKTQNMRTSALILLGTLLAFLDTANILGYLTNDNLVEKLERYNPLFSYHLSWLFPVAIYSLMMLVRHVLPESKKKLGLAS